MGAPKVREQQKQHYAGNVKVTRVSLFRNGRFRMVWLGEDGRHYRNDEVEAR